MKDKDISIYRLAQDSGIVEASLRKNFTDNVPPGYSKLSKISNSLNLSILEIYTYDESTVLLNDEEYSFIQNMCALPEEIAEGVLCVMREIANDRN